MLVFIFYVKFDGNWVGCYVVVGLVCVLLLVVKGLGVKVFDFGCGLGGCMF